MSFVCSIDRKSQKVETNLVTLVQKVMKLSLFLSHGKPRDFAAMITLISL